MEKLTIRGFEKPTAAHHLCTLAEIRNIYAMDVNVFQRPLPLQIILETNLILQIYNSSLLLLLLLHV